MVTSDVARIDCDNLFFSGDKTALYHRVTEEEDLTYGTQKLTYTTYTIPMQGAIMSIHDKMVKQGMLSDGDAAGVLRYEYTEESDGTTISPKIRPKQQDEITLLGRRFRFNNITPKMGEDHVCILNSFEAKPVSTTAERSFPYTFPIQF